MMLDGTKDTSQGGKVGRLTRGGETTSSTGSASSHVNDADGHVHHVHTQLPHHRYHQHQVVTLDSQDKVLMQQWSDIHDEWLHRHELWEQADQDQLDDPHGSIVGHGGEIKGIMVGGILAATTAFAPVGSQFAKKWELIKMAVHPAHRGNGLGKLLLRWTLDHLVDKIRKSGGGQGSISLDSSTKLSAALTLYKSHGFVVMHQRDLVAEAEKRAAWVVECEALKAEAKKASQWTKAEPVVLPAEPTSDFPCGYSTADIVMECALNPGTHTPWLSDDSTSSPRGAAQSVAHAVGGGSLRFVHVSGDEGTLDDIAVAILDIAAEQNKNEKSNRFLVLVDPLEDEPASEGMATYDSVCVAGAAILAHKLDPAGTLATSITGAIRPHSEALTDAVNLLETRVKI